jgi:hypothetical protein
MGPYSSGGCIVLGTDRPGDASLQKSRGQTITGRIVQGRIVRVPAYTLALALKN